jgi:hypothetical protein
MAQGGRSLIRFGRSGRRGPGSPTRRIDAPHAAPREKEIQEDEAVEDRRVASIEDGKEVLRRMRHEVGDRHVARLNERDRPCEEAKRKQHATE